MMAVEAIEKAPAAPRKLGKTGQNVWRAALRQCPWLTEGDLPVLERYAELCDERAELSEAVKSVGRVTRGSQGQLVDHPFVSQLRQVETLILRHEQVLGIGSIHRARLGIAVAKAAKERGNAEKVIAMYQKQMGQADGSH
jgi:P27 family predicted phage terminase small subunit